jgi:PIN domain-containing protein
VEPLWYVDADTLGLAHVLIRARRDVTFPGDDGVRHTSSWRMEPCVISDPGTSDEVWIPLVTRAGLAIISRDIHIASRIAEKDQALAVGARMFAITTPGNLSVWGLVEVAVTQWRKIEEAAREAGPYIYSVTRTTINKIDL